MYAQRKAHRKYFLALVVLLHASPFLYSLLKPAAPPPKQKVVINLIETEAKLIDKDERVGKNDIHSDCPKTYEGIGIKVTFGGSITAVAKGWPAAKAGVRVGDVIEGGAYGFQIENGRKKFTVIRDGQRIAFDLPIENICMRDEPTY